MKICGTGHRPSSLGVPDPYSPAIFDLMVQTADAWFARNPGVTDVICGMALGWDQAFATAAMDRMIPVHAYIPHAGQADSWPKESHVRYQRLLRDCASRRIVCHGPYYNGMMQRRNEAMVEDSDLVLALWNGSPGGTENCITFAQLEGKQIENLWEEFAVWL